MYVQWGARWWGSGTRSKGMVELIHFEFFLMGIFH